MSIRPIARNEVRRNRYKKFRKMKRQENLLKKLLKKRHKLSSSQLLSALKSSTKLENLPSMVTGVYSNNKIQLKATIQLRKLLGIEPEPIDEVVQSGVVPRLVEFLTREDFPKLQFEAARALTKIASGTSENTKVVIDHGAVSIFVKLLASPSDDVRQLAAWALGNIAANSPRSRDLVLGQGALIPLLFQLNERANLSMLRYATWTLSRFCAGKPQPQFEQIKPALPALECLLLHSKDKEVLKNACWALSCLSDATNEQIQAMIDAGICKRLVELLHHDPSPEVLIYALETIAYIMTGDDIQIQAVIETGVIAPLVKLLQTAEYVNVIKEAAWALSYATSRGTNKQIKYFVDQGCIKPLCDLLVRSDSRVLIVCLEVLENILKAGEAERNSAGEVNIYKDLIEDAEGLEKIKILGKKKIKILQSVDSDLVYEKAVKILETYWLEGYFGHLTDSRTGQDFQKCVKSQGWSDQVELS